MFCKQLSWKYQILLIGLIFVLILDIDTTFADTHILSSTDDAFLDEWQPNTPSGSSVNLIVRPDVLDLSKI